MALIRRLLRTVARNSGRTKWFHSRMDRARSGLEIGPCHNGIATKAGGWKVEIVDHLGQEDLRRKYAPHGMDVSRIEPVDHIWHGQPLPDLVAGRRYGWVVASHVAEHVPDLVRFLSGCLAILEPGGVLLLALPDHRRCFDADRQPSALSQILEAWEERRSRPSPGMVAEHHLRAVKKGGRLSWPAWWPGTTERIHPDEEAAELWALSRSDDTYRDVHAWCFTPDAFVRLIADLRALGLVRARMVDPPSRRGQEFLVALEPDPSAPSARDRIDPSGRLG